MNSLRRSGHAAVVAALLAISPAQAQKVDERLREQLRSTVTQMRALADENASLKAQLAQVPSTPAEDPARLGRLQKDVGRLRAELDLTKQKLDQEQQKAAAQKLAFDAQTSAAERERRDKLAALQKVLSAQRKSERDAKALEQCSADNRTLVTISNELIERYRDRGVFDVLAAREPITGLRGAQLERLVQSYHVRVSDLAQRPADLSVGTSNETEK